MKPKSGSHVSRRDFIRKTAVGAAAGLTFLKPVWAQQPQELKAGLIGCGGRGTGAAGNFQQSAPNCKVVALADAFEDKVERLRDRLDVPKEMCFSGLDAYGALVDSDIDVVLLATPPYFRPEHLRAAVEAGKHVFTEKPVAVDPVGIRTFIEAGKKAAELGLSIVAGTQRRHEFQRLEVQKRIADGMIGKVVAMRCYWVGRPVHRWFPKEEGWSDIEFQIRNWVHYDWLSGDHIVEQHIHNLDVCNWFAQAHPTEALGFGARVQRGVGNIYDFFAVDFTYPEGVHCSSFCRQIDDCDRAGGEVVTCEKGTTNCNDTIWDHEGNVLYKYAGQKPKGQVQEHTDLVNAIRNNQPINEAQNVAEATMAATMGRDSAYTGKRIKWDDYMKSDRKLGPDELKWGEYEADEPPKPGKAFTGQ